MSTWDNIEKSGNAQGWEYDETNLLYNSPTDPDSGSIIYYNGVGTASSITNEVKH